VIDEDQRRHSVAGWTAYPRFEPHGVAARIDHGNGQILALEFNAAGGSTANTKNEREHKGEKCARTRLLHSQPAQAPVAGASLRSTRSAVICMAPAEVCTVKTT
jgi:hypothetical protein